MSGYDSLRSRTPKETLLEGFIKGLKSKNEDTRYKTARELHHYVSTELQEMSVEEIHDFMEKFNIKVQLMMSNGDINEKKGGILAIIVLIGVDVGNQSTRVSRFANYVRTLAPTDVGLMELVAYAVARIAVASGTPTLTYVDYEVRRAIEWLSGERNEAKRHGAVLILRELATSTPACFFQQVQQFFECIFTAIRDKEKKIREGAVGALRAALAVTASRETKETPNPPWYAHCYKEALKGFDESFQVMMTKEKVTKDDIIHSSLLVLNELLRCSNIEREKIRQELEEMSFKPSQETMNPLEKYQGLKEKTSSFTRSLRVLSSSSNQQFYTPGHGLKGLSAIVQYHKSTGVTPGSAPQSRKLPLYESPTCRKLISENFNNICQIVLKQRSSRNVYVHHVLFLLIPRLAAFDPITFSSHYLSETMGYLLKSLNNNRERSQAFLALGLLAIAVSNSVKSYLPKILEAIRMNLPSKESSSRKRGQLTEPAVFSCISLLGQANSLLEKDDVKELLEPMIGSGFSPALVSALHDLTIQMPDLKKDIQDGLLKMLSYVLMQKPYRHPGAPKRFQLTSNSFPPPYNLSDGSDISSIILGLKILGTFDFQSKSLMQFARHCADNYLTSDFTEIRLEAVKTCCHLLSPALHKITQQYSPSLMVTIQDVLSKLLIAAVTDLDPQVRYSILSLLDERFDGHLAQAENLSALFICLNDEIFEISELTLCTIGRLSSLNPAYVMPSLRKVLLQLLTDLEFSGVKRNKERSSKMLGHLIANAPRLIRPYTQSIITIFLSKLREPEQYSSVVISVLSAIGAQCQVSGIEMRIWIDELFPIILDFVQDSSSIPKREVGLWTLGHLVDSTGYVVEPYWKYPNLLDILLNFLKTEQSPATRREVIRVLGLLGAIDPYKLKVNLGMIDQAGDTLIFVADSSQEMQELSASEMLVNFSGTYDDFYPAIAIATLIRVLRDPALFQHHCTAVGAVTYIFTCLGTRCVPYIQQILPVFISIIKSSESREYLFQELGNLIAVVGQHIRNYLDDIFSLIKEFWTVTSSMQSTLIQLLEKIAKALGGEFKIYLPQIIPNILHVFNHDDSKNRMVTEKLLNALQQFGTSLEDYLHLILPPIVKLFDARDSPQRVREAALKTIESLAEHLEISDFASRIIHPLIRVLELSPELRESAMNTLCALVVQMGRKYQIFIPMTQKIISKYSIEHQRYQLLVDGIMQGHPLGEDDKDPMMSGRKHGKQRSSHVTAPAAASNSAPKDITLDKSRLASSWKTDKRVSKDDWLNWLQTLSIGLIEQSASHALRSCLLMAQAYQPLARDLFNASFLSCWSQLDDGHRENFIDNIRAALTAQDIPEVTQTLLNLAEFMEHCDDIGPLPLEAELLAERALKCRAFAKALHYKEIEFRNHKNGPTTSILESLISINNKLQQPEAAAGALVYAKKHHEADLKIKERWYEKLNDWENALKAYRHKRDCNPEDMESIIGQMRCLEALGEWVDLHHLASEIWPQVDSENKQMMARMASTAAWGLEKWDALEEYSDHIKKDTTDAAFYKAVIAVHKEDYQVAQRLIDKARDQIDTDLTAMAGESQIRAYGAMVQVMMFSELEEVIQYKLVQERREIIKQKWWERIQGCQRVVEDWQKILMVHQLVLKPEKDEKTWLKFASLCQKNGRLNLSHKTLTMLLKYDPTKDETVKQLPTDRPHVTFGYIKHMWDSGQKDHALNQLQHFVHHVSSFGTGIPGTVEEASKRLELDKLLSRCYLKLGNWQENLKGINENSIPNIIKYYALATEKDRDWYKAWHAYAYMNFEAVLYYKQAASHHHLDGDESFFNHSFETARNTPAASVAKPTTERLNIIRNYSIPAVRGFFRSIALSHGNSLQDTLRLLTLWFDDGQYADVFEALSEGLKTVPIQTWLQVIPQLIARIDTSRHFVGRLIHQLLVDIGKCHPQALIYPLTVASKSTVESRQSAANKVLESMKKHSGNLVQEAISVSEELIRVAILWHELWHEGLEEASRLYFGEHNVQGMFDTLEPLHAMMKRGPQTMKEESFYQAYGADLAEAQEWCRKYQKSHKVKDLTNAWDLYYVVFRRICKQLPALTSLELRYVSPRLLKCRDLELAVPGSYNPNQPVIRIAQVDSALQVITSKQRPRKLCIRGSDGKNYIFLLKGHEDLRQDERVMQLFGLVNTLLVKNPETSRRNLAIQRYAVIPLAPNSGLIGWVPHCDTLHTLIKDYREKRNVLPNLEYHIMKVMAREYERLTLMQKVEVFEHAMNNSQGDDLVKLLWLKSPSSEVWFDRRTNYTRSLAVMSMVGYVLGLGDRHPSNLMLDRLSGKILHIDFGDCFEVAKTREKFPEKIPFRLTRMLINAMEVTGIEGTYRITCEKVMTVLRNNKDSLMAVLEAFVYDPLLNWRLVDAQPNKTKPNQAMGQEAETAENPESETVDQSDAAKKAVIRPVAVSHVTNGMATDNKEPSITPTGTAETMPSTFLGINGYEETTGQPEALNKKALSVINRVRDKLTGRDFNPNEKLAVPQQVDLLIKQATSKENLCQCYIGWCPFW
ncbi:serine/threonine-protein kinase mTOR [Tetranychus urticae]|uniref:non-specific serine/threonine protein kinase n=1 Tax=Tetranychus urticae TaxID=32264 RepID=T1K204_TETUR|nr:serine/threonine-protein kinase mTOR [Tetranychus urticae]